MKFLKIGLILTMVGLFIFACAQNAANTNSTNKTITQNVNGTTVSYDPVATNSTSNANKPAPANDELASSKKIYTEKCVLCHKDTGEGGQADLDGDKFKVPSFKGDKALKADDKDFNYMITNGEEKMPGFGKKLKPEEIAGLVKYIRKEFQGK